MENNQNLKMQINKPAPNFIAEAYHKNKIKKVSLSNYKGKWVVLFFYPADFSFVCPTELGELAKNYDEFKKLGAEVISVSTDTVFVHKAWYDTSKTINQIKFPMVADPTRKICLAYGTLIEEEGLSLRGTFIINTEGKVVASEINSNDIGRSIKELLRKLRAAKYVSEHEGNVCPVNWEEGQKTLKPGLELVGKI